MMGTVYTKTYTPMPFNKKEILRYAGVSGNGEDISGLIDECISEVKDRLVYNVCYSQFQIAIDDSCINLGFMKTTSKDLRKNLKDCNSIILFGATIGLEMDRLIARYGVVSPLKALIFQSIGAERIESLCDCFNNEIMEKYSTTPRFSAGYGDFEIYTQREIFNALDCGRRIGLTLNESLLMSPSKSVTAIIGVK